MHPILIEVGPFALYTYGFLVAVAFLLGTLWLIQRAKAQGQNVDHYLQATFWIIVCGFIGARLMYFFYYPEYYLAAPLRLITDRGGLVWYGGLISAIVAGITYLKLNRLSIRKFGDAIMPPAALGLAFGRIGCFFAGCCYGKTTDSPLGVQFPIGHETHPVLVHPTQLYETAALLLFLPLLIWVDRRSKTPGITFATFLMGASVIRFIIEYFRGDGIYWVDNLFTASQVISLAGMGLGVILLVVFRFIPVAPANPFASPGLKH